MEKGIFVACAALGLFAQMAVFFPLGAKRRASIPPAIWWLFVIAGAIACLYALVHSTAPSFAPRTTVVGRAFNCIEKRLGQSTKFSFHFVPDNGSPIDIETHIIMPHWGNSAEFNGRAMRIVYLNDTTRDPRNEAIDITILKGDNAGWHDSRDARVFGAWLLIPLGGALGGFGYFGVKYRTDDLKEAEREEEASLAGGL